MTYTALEPRPVPQSESLHKKQGVLRNVEPGEELRPPQGAKFKWTGLRGTGRMSRKVQASFIRSMNLLKEMLTHSMDPKYEKLYNETLGLLNKASFIKEYGPKFELSLPLVEPILPEDIPQKVQEKQDKVQAVLNPEEDPQFAEFSCVDSHINHIRYWPLQQEMEVTFTNNSAKYTYHPVTPDIYAELELAEKEGLQVGKIFWERVRGRVNGLRVRSGGRPGVTYTKTDPGTKTDWVTRRVGRKPSEAELVSEILKDYGYDEFTARDLNLLRKTTGQSMIELVKDFAEEESERALLAATHQWEQTMRQQDLLHQQAIKAKRAKGALNGFKYA